MKRTSSYPIYQSKFNLYIGFFASLLLACLCWAAIALSLFVAAKGKGMGEYLGANLVLLGLALLITFLVIRSFSMILNAGKPIATIDASGIILRNGKVLSWGDIEGLRIISISTVFFITSHHLEIRLTKGKKRVPIVKVTQEELADLIEEVRQ